MMGTGAGKPNQVSKFYTNGLEVEHAKSIAFSSGDCDQQDPDKTTNKAIAGRKRRPQLPPAPLELNQQPPFHSSQDMELERDDGANIASSNKKKILVSKKALAQQVKKLQEQNQFLIQERNEIKRLFDEACEVQVAKSEEVKLLRQETDELRHRLSKVASDRLTDNNPNIADLSDGNRATKIGERFSELYSNEWSDAYEELTANQEISGKDAIEVLLNIIEAVYSQCKDKARSDMDNLKSAILGFTGHTELSKDLDLSLKRYKEERKKNYKKSVPNLEEVVKVFVPNKETDKKGNVSVDCYAQEATEICWLMCIQDPPLELYTNCNKGSVFNYQFFDAYTVRGKKYAYLVWPALLLHDNGPILHKGVAQGMKKKKTKRNAWTEQVHQGERTEDSVVGDDDLSRISKQTEKDLMLSSIHDKTGDQQNHENSSLLHVCNINDKSHEVENRSTLNVEEAYSQERGTERDSERSREDIHSSNVNDSKLETLKSSKTTSDTIEKIEYKRDGDNNFKGENLIISDKTISKMHKDTKTRDQGMLESPENDGSNSPKQANSLGNAILQTSQHNDSEHNNSMYAVKTLPENNNDLQKKSNSTETPTAPPRKRRREKQAADKNTLKPST